MAFVDFKFLIEAKARKWENFGKDTSRVHFKSSIPKHPQANTQQHTVMIDDAKVYLQFLRDRQDSLQFVL